MDFSSQWLTTLPDLVAIGLLQMVGTCKVDKHTDFRFMYFIFRFVPSAISSVFKK